ncbi:MAG: FAD-dependent oxidoreductase, partial [Candidatus Hodarchaeota archaeon]
IVQLPIGANFVGPNSEVTNRTIAYYVERAKGGTGLIIVGGNRALPISRPIDNRYLNLADDRLLSSHYYLVEAVQSYGAKIAIQLCHPGSQVSLADYGGEPPPSPSGIQQVDVLRRPLSMPRVMTRGEIYQVIEGFAKAAANARRAGYDMVEIHAAHGYLLGAFISSATNKRSDEFGGSLENRTRFVTEIIKGAHQMAGADYQIGVRFSADEFISGGITTQESPAIAKLLEEAGAAYMNISCGTYATHHKMNDVMRMEEGWKVPIWSIIKQSVKSPTIAGGGNRNPDFCERLIAEGKADFVGLGRQLLADPYWPQKALEGRLDDINRCISCLRCLYGLSGGIQIVRHCAVNAMWGREVDFINAKPACFKKKVLVVGGGPAGMEAARVASLGGHEVTLYEKKQELGGQLILSGTIPGKSKILWFRDYLAGQLKKQGVNTKLGFEVGPETVHEAEPEVVIIATGAKPSVPDIPGIMHQKVTTAWDVLSSEPKLKGDTVTVVGGGMVGCETAELLRKRKYNVTIVEMLPTLAQNMEPLNRRALLDELKKYEVKILVGKRAVEIVDTGIIIADTLSGLKQLIQADQVVLALGTEPVRSLAKSLEDISSKLYIIGDCQEPRTILEAVQDGFLAGYSIC